MATDGFAPFEYGRYYRSLRSGARFALNLSGVSDAGLADLEPGAAPLPVEGRAAAAALEQWRERIAARYGVPAACVLPASGTHGAISLALTAIHTLLPRGAAIAVERPAYGIFESAAGLAGREVVHVDRLAQDGYAIPGRRRTRVPRRGARLLRREPEQPDGRRGRGRGAVGARRDRASP